MTTVFPPTPSTTLLEPTPSLAKKIKNVGLSTLIVGVNTLAAGLFLVILTHKSSQYCKNFYVNINQNINFIPLIKNIFLLGVQLLVCVALAKKVYYYIKIVLPAHSPVEPPYTNDLDILKWTTAPIYKAILKVADRKFAVLADCFECVHNTNFTEYSLPTLPHLLLIYHGAFTAAFTAKNIVNLTSSTYSYDTTLLITKEILADCAVVWATLCILNAACEKQIKHVPLLPKNETKPAPQLHAESNIPHKFRSIMDNSQGEPSALVDRLSKEEFEELVVSFLDNKNPFLINILSKVKNEAYLKNKLSDKVQKIIYKLVLLGLKEKNLNSDKKAYMNVLKQRLCKLSPHKIHSPLFQLIHAKINESPQTLSLLIQAQNSPQYALLEFPYKEEIKQKIAELESRLYQAKPLIPSLIPSIEQPINKASRRVVHLTPPKNDPSYVQAALAQKHEQRRFEAEAAEKIKEDRRLEAMKRKNKHVTYEKMKQAEQGPMSLSAAAAAAPAFTTDRAVIVGHVNPHYVPEIKLKNMIVRLECGSKSYLQAAKNHLIEFLDHVNNPDASSKTSLLLYHSAFRFCELMANHTGSKEGFSKWRNFLRHSFLHSDDQLYAKLAKCFLRNRLETKLTDLMQGKTSEIDLILPPIKPAPSLEAICKHLHSHLELIKAWKSKPDGSVEQDQFIKPEFALHYRAVAAIILQLGGSLAVLREAGHSVPSELIKYISYANRLAHEAGEDFLAAHADLDIISPQEAEMFYRYDWMMLNKLLN